MFLGQKIQLCQSIIKLIYRFNMIRVKITVDFFFFFRNPPNDFKIHRAKQRTYNSQNYAGVGREKKKETELENYHYLI